MELTQLWLTQQRLDNRIQQLHQVTYATTMAKLKLAILVELGELANETRCFKYWSIKPASPKEVILEEYVDGLHFLLSYGLALGFSESLTVLTIHKTSKPLTEQFLDIYALVGLWQPKVTLIDYKKCFQSFLNLAGSLGFTEQEIVQFYEQKNAVNHQRQDQHY